MDCFQVCSNPNGVQINFRGDNLSSIICSVPLPFVVTDGGITCEELSHNAAGQIAYLDADSRSADDFQQIVGYHGDIVDEIVVRRKDNL